MIRDVVSDLTALLLPLPTIPAPGAGDNEREVWSMVADQVHQQREELAEQLRLGWEDGDVDPLLGEVAAARRQMLAAEPTMRLLIAYGREFVGPRPYTLEGLAQAAGMPISGVRTAYDDEVAEVAIRIGVRPRRRATAGPTPSPVAAADAGVGVDPEGTRRPRPAVPRRDPPTPPRRPGTVRRSGLASLPR